MSTDMFRTLDEADVRGKRVLVRVDLNVPVDNGKVTDTTRIERVAPTIREIGDKVGKVILLSHLGRPKGPDPAQSLKLLTPAIAAVLKRPVAFVEDCISEGAAAAINAMKSGDILCLENTRFHPGEERNDPAFVAQLASPRDVFVNEPSRYRTAPMPRSRASLTGCRPMPRAPCRMNSRRSQTYCRPRPVRSRRSSAEPRCRPSSTCSATCWKRSTLSSSAAAWPTRFWPRADIRWVNRCASAICCRLRARSWPRRRPKAASSYCRSTPWLPRRLRRTHPRAWSRWTAWAAMR